MKLASPEFASGESIPAIFTQEGDNMSPPLQWSDAPRGTVSFALIVEDPDTSKGVMTHWVLYNIPHVIHALDHGIGTGAHYGTKALQGKNAQDKLGYIGPKPPSGEHRYIFTLYALDIELPLEEGATKEEVLMAMHGHIIDQAKLTGLYAKHESVEISKELLEERSEEDAYDLSVHKDRLQPETNQPASS